MQNAHEFLVVSGATFLTTLVANLMLEYLWLRKKTKDERKVLGWVAAAISGFCAGLGLGLGMMLADHFGLR